MKVLALSIVMLFFFSPKGIDDVRVAFQKANLNQENALLFNALIKEDLTLEKTLRSAYLGASETLLAKFGNSPGEKLKLFKAGKAKIEEAINKEPNSVEIRLIRLIIQNNAPSMLKYSGQIDSDKEFILKNYHSAPSDVQKFIQSVANDTDYFTSEEKTNLK